MHCPHDYFYDYEMNFMKWNPEGGTVYQRLGEPLVTVEDEPVQKDKQEIPESADTEVSETVSDSWLGCDVLFSNSTKIFKL